MQRATILILITLVTLSLTACERPPKSKELYTCGMHPQVIQEGPGSCPICGMDLTPMKKRTGKDITIDPVMTQNMGIRVAPVARGTISRKIRTIGEVVVAEDLLSVVNLKYSGWIERLYVNRTGVKVRRGQRLFRIYSPELVAAQDEYLLAVKAAGKDSPLARAARTKLGFWDLSDRHLRRIERAGKAQRTLTITAPRAGYVLHKNVVQGARVMAGQDLFRIGKLSAIWVHAQVYEFDAPWVRVGQPATMELAFQRGRLYTGKVSYIYPTLNPKSRTLTVRLEFINPELQLKPGMFATVRIDTKQRTGVLKIPTEAILFSGERLMVFVAKAVGKYEPREIATGMTGDDHMTEVISGLKEGEQVVTSGQFLLDSESQIQEARQKLLASRLHAKGASSVTSQPASQPSSQPTSQPSDHQGHAHATWTCPMHAQIKEAGPGQCPICGMKLERTKPAASKPASRPASQRTASQPAASQPAASQPAASRPSATPNAKWTCPMHANIVRTKRGSCPICAMELVKQETVSGTREKRRR